MIPPFEFSVNPTSNLRQLHAAAPFVQSRRPSSRL